MIQEILSGLTPGNLLDLLEAVHADDIQRERAIESWARTDGAQQFLIDPPEREVGETWTDWLRRAMEHREGFLTPTKQFEVSYRALICVPQAVAAETWPQWLERQVAARMAAHLIVAVALESAGSQTFLAKTAEVCVSQAA